jgi:hypothetical protein
VVSRVNTATVAFSQPHAHPLVCQGVAVGSGVAMMSMQMMEQEAKPVAAHSVAEARKSALPARGFAARSAQ